MKKPEQAMTLPPELEALRQETDAMQQAYGRTRAWAEDWGRFIAMGPQASILRREEWKGTPQENDWYEQITVREEEQRHALDQKDREVRNIVLGDTKWESATPEQKAQLGLWRAIGEATITRVQRATFKGEVRNWLDSGKTTPPPILAEEQVKEPLRGIKSRGDARTEAVRPPSEGIARK